MRKITAVLTLVIILVILVSGCLENDLCKELEKEMKERNVTCYCTKTNVIPSEYENLSVEPKCSCLCFTQGKWINTTIAVSNNSD